MANQLIRKVKAELGSWFTSSVGWKFHDGDDERKLVPSDFLTSHDLIEGFPNGCLFLTPNGHFWNKPPGQGIPNNQRGWSSWRLRAYFDLASGTIDHNAVMEYALWAMHLLVEGWTPSGAVEGDKYEIINKYVQMAPGEKVMPGERLCAEAFMVVFWKNVE
jgi:hypothetical protein